MAVVTGTKTVAVTMLMKAQPLRLSIRLKNPKNMTKENISII